MVKYKYIGDGKFTYHDNQYKKGEVIEIDPLDVDKLDFNEMIEAKEGEAKGVEKPSDLDEQKERLENRIARRENELKALKLEQDKVEKPKRKKIKRGEE